MSASRPEFGPAEREAMLSLIRVSLDEDRATHDITSELAVPPDLEGRAEVRARERGVIAGLAVWPLGLEAFGGGSRAVLQAQDGDAVEPDTLLASVEGPLRELLAVERTALNILGMLSGTATLTRRYVDAAGPSCAVLDTRKTWPGGRVLQKYAVRCGGGQNHRRDLSDAILLKDNHRWSGLSLSALVSEARRRYAGRFLEVEVDDLEQLEEVLALDVDRILLDNFGPAAIAEAVRRRRKRDSTVPLEVSGGVRLDTVRALADAGADCVSVGALTHSAPALDVGLDLELLPGDGSR